MVLVRTCSGAGPGTKYGLEERLLALPIPPPSSNDYGGEEEGKEWITLDRVCV